MKHQYIRQKNIRQKIKWMLVLLMAVSLSACGVKEEKNRQQAEENSAEESISKDGTYEIAFISGEGELDDSGFHESSWEGIAEYADENRIKAGHFVSAGLQGILFQLPDGGIVFNNIDHLSKSSAD